jgi:hypothetical protein
MILGGLVLAGLAVIALIATVSRPNLPQVGDHWHARYLIVICGKPVPDMPFTQGGIHTQGDGVIHIEPATASEAGRNANLRQFFASGGVRLTSAEIAFPTGTVFRNGDRCPDGTVGSMRLLVNGRVNSAFERYVPADGDTIVVQFGS